MSLECQWLPKLKNLSVALLSRAKKSECGTAQPSEENLSVSLLSLFTKSKCGTAQPS